MSLSSCGTARSGDRPTILRPERPVYKPVKVIRCRDEVCPKHGEFVMTRKNFINLQENLVNSSTYTQKLERLLDTLAKEARP